MFGLNMGHEHYRPQAAAGVRTYTEKRASNFSRESIAGIRKAWTRGITKFLIGKSGLLVKNYQVLIYEARLGGQRTIRGNVSVG